MDELGTAPQLPAEDTAEHDALDEAVAELERLSQRRIALEAVLDMMD